MLMSSKNILAVIALFSSTSVSAGGVMHIGVAASDGPPIAEFTAGRLSGGLSYDIGRALARAMQMEPDFVIVSRKRVESTVESGRVDLICNANPSWFANPEKLLWSREIYPQIERFASLKALPDIHDRSELAGKRIGAIRGYSYPTLDYLWAQGSSYRTDENNLELELKGVLKSVTELAIVSELEFSHWARTNPSEARRLKLHPMIVTALPTMCAVSPAASFPLIQLDQAIVLLQKSGQLKTLLKTYQWTTKAPTAPLP